MSKGLKAKIAACLLIVAAGLAFMGAVVCQMQDSISVDGFKEEMTQELSQLPDSLDQAAQNEQTDTAAYDELYQSKASSVAFMAQNNAGFAATDAKMSELKELLDVDNVSVVTKAGSVVAQAQDSKVDFSASRFNRLRQVFDSGKASDAVCIDLDGMNRHERYYAAKLDGSTMVVVEQDGTELADLVEQSDSAASVLRGISVGSSGYVFSVSAKDYLIGYHPDEALQGADALQAGIDAASLEDGSYGWMELDGTRLYCGVSQIGDSYYIAAVPEADISSARGVTVAATLVAFAVVMLAVVLYGICVLRDEERRQASQEDFTPFGPFVVNRKTARKGAVMSFVGFVAVVVIAFYMQTLFALSAQSLTNSHRAQQVAQSIESAQESADDLRELYSERYLNKAQVAAYILDANPKLENTRDLGRLADVLCILNVHVFDANGHQVASNTGITNFTLSEDPQSQSYEFRKLLQGADHVVQDAQVEETSGELRQYIGVVLHDADGACDGFVQLGMRPSRLADMLRNVELDHVLGSVRIGTDGFAFAVNASDGTFAYYPDAKLTGKSAVDCGMTQDQLKDGFNDYLTVNGTSYYAASVQQGDYLIYVAGSEGTLMRSRGPITLVVALVSLVCQLLVFMLVTLERRRKKDVQGATGQTPGESRMFDVTTPDGRTISTESVSSRFSGVGFKWHDKTPEQKVAAFLKAMIALSAIAICLAVVLKDQVFGADSIFTYIIAGGWTHGVNIFAITASIMFACVAFTAATVLQRLLRLAATAMGSRGETVCRLVASFIKYATIIGMLYYCLSLLGVDTTTLLASAGILSIAISFGAKELVSDILSGLFIIFEGEFRVGDIITVGTWTGTVVEIGVRTTKVMNGAQNIKVIRNSNVSDIVNMTKQLSYTWVDVGIEYSESLERVEAILARELPAFAQTIPAIVRGPFYKGVVSLGESSVNIRIMVQCAEKDRGQVERDLNREIKLLFDRYDIGMPFPQIVVNQPLERRDATEGERYVADIFNKEQAQASADIEVDSPKA